MSHMNSQLDCAACLDTKKNFLADAQNSYCNIALAAYLGLRGRVIPITKTANELFDWFSSPKAVGDGWAKANAAEALKAANADGDVVAIAKDLPHGHCAAVVESLPNTPGRLCVFAAGSTNFVRAPIERSFGSLVPHFFVCK